MLLNLSNHPSHLWPKEQLNLAKQLFGDIIDIPFPDVSPSGDEKYIDQLSDEYLDKILDILFEHPKTPFVVHIMGELTFCFSLIKKLQQYNITCVASTTRRISEITPDNKKISKFDFVQFRKYN
jgi:hypothetical protein